MLKDFVDQSVYMVTVCMMPVSVMKVIVVIIVMSSPVKDRRRATITVSAMSMDVAHVIMDILETFVKKGPAPMIVLAKVSA